MRLTILIFLMACSQIPSSGEKFGKKVPEKEIYGYWHETHNLLKEPGTNKKTDIIFTRGEKATVSYTAFKTPPGDTKPRKFLFIKTDKGHGWVKEDFTCSPPTPRTSRDALKVWKPTKHRCPLRRTLEKDRDFFSGKFETNKDKLITTYHQGKIIYELDIKDPNCTKVERGRLNILGNSADSKHLKMNFTDDFVVLKFGPDSDCPNFTKDFYYPSALEHTCNLEATGTNHKDLLEMFYELKRSVKYDDAIRLSALITFPIFTKVRSKVVEIKSPQQFIKLYPRIKNLCFKDYIENLRLTDLNCGIRGITWGNGKIWFLQKIHKIKFDNMCIPDQESYWK